MNQQPLTKRQREVFDYLRQHIAERGFAPSIAEMNTAIGIRSLSTGFKHLETLCEKGYIARRPFKSRAIEIMQPPDCCQACGRPFGENPPKTC